MLLCGFPACAFRAADRGCEVSTRPSLRPLGQEGGVTKQSSGEIRREDAKACLQLKSALEDGDAAPCSVIASAAKQSSLPPRRDSGLLPPSLKLRRTSRCACNNDVETVCATRRSRAPDAAQRHFDGALQSRGPSRRITPCRPLDPGSAQQRSRVAARPGHGTHSLHTSITTKCPSSVFIRKQSFPIIPQCKRPPANPGPSPVRPAVPGSST